MIDKALDLLKTELQGYLSALPELNVTSESVVWLTGVVKGDGSMAIPENTLGLTLVNIEEERITKSQQAFERGPDGTVSYVNPEIKLNLYMLIAANFKNYTTGLEFLSGAIRFFQGKSVFTPDNTPLLNTGIEKLLVELYTVSFEQQNHLWGSLGAKYLPSVMYRVRLVIIQEGRKSGEKPPITKLDFRARGIF